MNKLALSLFSILFAGSISAETLSLPQAIEKALVNDPRISELEHYVKQAQALKLEANASDDFQFTGNTFLGLSPALDGGFFTNEDCGAGETCQLRVDRYKLNDGISPWWYLEFGLIKPLNTFGKVENYVIAAEKNIKLKEQDVRLQRGDTVYDVKRAYFGYLTARDSRLFLNDVADRIDGAIETVQTSLDDEDGNSTKSDLYALQSAQGLAQSYLKKAAALEQVAIQGLKVLVGVPLDSELDVADKGLRAVELPDLVLEKLTQKALSDRPEMNQLQNGIEAQNALIRAKKAMKRPNLYAGLVGALSYSPLRDRVDNPHIYDPFNDFGSTPVIGLQWQWEGGVQDARVKQAQAELGGIMEKSRFAQQGIPYQVSEAHAQVNAYYESSEELKRSAKAARRWMISLYTEFEAGLQPVDKLVSAFQAYVLTYSEYLQTVYAYNMQVAQLEKVTGDYE